jgi:hypothetical protein
MNAEIEVRIYYNSNSRSSYSSRKQGLRTENNTKHFLNDRIKVTLPYKTEEFDITAW